LDRHTVGEIRCGDRIADFVSFAGQHDKAVCVHHLFFRSLRRVGISFNFGMTVEKKLEIFFMGIPSSLNYLLAV
jgi:hypothetical protein